MIIQGRRQARELHPTSVSGNFMQISEKILNTQSNLLKIPTAVTRIMTQYRISLTKIK